jgi:hypothetical protein
MSEKRIISILKAKKPSSKRSRSHRKNTIITNWKAKTRKEERQNETKQQEREKSDYLFVENKHRKASHTRKPKNSAVDPIVIAPLSILDTRSRPQLVDQSIRGSRADIQGLNDTIRGIYNRVYHTTNKIKTVFKAHNIPTDDGQLKALSNAQQDLAALPQQIDRAVSAASTLALVEGRHWRLNPSSLVHGLVFDTISSEREADVTTRLTRTPLKATRASVDEEATKQIEAFSEALALEIKATLDQRTALETLQHAQNLICELYDEGILRSTLPDSAQRIAMRQKLQGLRVLQKTVLRQHKTGLSTHRQKPDVDPAEEMQLIPPPALMLERHAVVEKS